MSREADAIKLQLQRSNDLISEVPVHLENKFYNTAINRLYYACFYAARALLLCKNLTPKTHTGILKSMYSEFILEKVMDEKHAKLLARLLQLRTKADYDGSFTAKKEDVENIFSQAIELISFAEKYSNDIIE